MRGRDNAAKPKPAGQQNMAATRTTASIFPRSSGKFFLAQAPVTLGRALTPRAWVTPGTNRYTVMANV